MMKRRSFIFLSVMAACLCANPTLAQQSVVIVLKPASTNVPGAMYPRIDNNRTAIFQITAPNASRVSVSIAGKSTPMIKNDGVWSLATEPLVVGFHYYQLNIDGVMVADPASETFFGMGANVSGIEVPSPGEDFYEFKDVPHGILRVHAYLAKTSRAQRKAMIYTPPGYETELDKRYPVLYLQHGYGEDWRGWSNQGRVANILDNLLAEKKIKPMIVVMEDGGIATGIGGAPGGRRGGAPGSQPANRFAFTEAFEPIMVNEVIPMVDSTFRTIADRDHRAIAGLSMGGLQTFQISLNHLDLFSYIGGFSPGLPHKLAQRLSADKDNINAKVKVLFLGTGTVERDSNPNIKVLHEDLDKAGVKNVYYESPGTAHEWLTWRRDLYQFAPLLFQD